MHIYGTIRPAHQCLARPTHSAGHPVHGSASLALGGPRSAFGWRGLYPSDRSDGHIPMAKR